MQISKNKKRTRSLFAQLNIYVTMVLSSILKACTKEPLRVKVSHDFSVNTSKGEENTSKGEENTDDNGGNSSEDKGKQDDSNAAVISTLTSSVTQNNNNIAALVGGGVGAQSLINAVGTGQGSVVTHSHSGVVTHSHTSQGSGGVGNQNNNNIADNELDTKRLEDDKGRIELKKNIAILKECTKESARFKVSHNFSVNTSKGEENTSKNENKTDDNGDESYNTNNNLNSSTKENIDRKKTTSQVCFIKNTLISNKELSEEIYKKLIEIPPP